VRQSLYRLHYVSENLVKYVEGLTLPMRNAKKEGGKFLIFRKGNPAKMMPIY
jgi:hypothetical protein